MSSQDQPQWLKTLKPAETVLRCSKRVLSQTDSQYLNGLINDLVSSMLEKKLPLPLS